MFTFLNIIEAILGCSNGVYSFEMIKKRFQGDAWKDNEIIKINVLKPFNVIFCC